MNALDPEEAVERYQLDHWGVNHGLPTDSVISILQTPDGYLWLGTMEGLVKYDGRRFRPVHFEDESSGGSPMITAMEKNSSGGLWLGTGTGLFSLEDHQLKHYSWAEGFPRFGILGLKEDSFGTLWICTMKDYLYCIKDGEFTHFGKNSGLGSPEVYNILEDSTGSLWVANSEAGLYVGHNGKFTRFQLPVPGLPGNYSVYSLYEDRKGVLWVGTNAGLIGIAHAGTSEQQTAGFYSPANGLSDNNIWCIREDKHGNLWAGTENGLNRIRRHPGGGVEISSCMNDSLIQYIFEDREESLWVGTLGSDLKRLRDTTFSTYWKNAGLPYWRLSLHRDSKGVIRVGSSVGDLYRFQPGSGKFKRVLRTGNTIESEILCIEEDSRENLWLGTVSRGILVVKNGKIIRRYTQKDGLPNGGILSLLRDRRGRMWTGTDAGMLYCFHNGKFQPVKASREFLKGEIPILREDREHNIYVGTENGLFILEKGNPAGSSVIQLLKGKEILEIFQDPDQENIFWVTAENNGISMITFPGGSVSTFTAKDGLPSDSIYNIREDHRDNFWFTTYTGIYKTNKNYFFDIAKGEKKKIPCTGFGITDGLKSTKCRGWPSDSVLKLPGGELWFSTLKGISVVDPGKVTINKYPPPVVIDGVFFNYRSIPLEQSGSSFKGLKEVFFTFNVPTFVSPGRVKIKYKLEGYDRQWRETGAFKPRKIHYRNLPPGNYRFHVIAANSSGIWNHTGADFSFIVKPYLHEQLWFQLLIILLISGKVTFISFIVRRYIALRRLKQKYKNSTLDPEKAEKYLKLLQYQLDVKKVYQDEELTLNSLAGILKVAPRYLSQLVNERLNKNFRDLVNSRRIEEAKQLLANPGKKELSILEIAYEVGFNSKEVFNRAFKKYTGMTPSQYKKQETGEDES